MKKVTIELPFPPTINHVMGQRGYRKYIKPIGVAYKNTVLLEIKKQAPKIYFKDHWLALSILAYFPADGRTQKSDCDNRIKFLQDCLSVSKWNPDGLIDNDRNIAIIRIERAYKKDGQFKDGKIIIEISELEPRN